MIPPSTVEGDATYVGFLERLFANLEEVLTNLDDLVDKESCALLAHATTRIFANLAHLHPGVDLKTVTVRLQGAAKEKAGAVLSEVEAFVQLFERVEDKPEDGDDDEGSEEGSSEEDDQTVGGTGSRVP